jgi:hypothetical protein
VRVAPAAVLALVLAGCVGPPSAPSGPDGGAATFDAAAVEAALGAPLVLDHDHTRGSLHAGAFNVDFVAWSSLGVTLGENGFANFVFWNSTGEQLAFVAIDGDATGGGFVVADVRDPRHIVPLGRYQVKGSGIQEVRAFPDGSRVVMNVQELPSAGVLTDVQGLQDCGVCLHVVNVEDRAQPRLESVIPVAVVGSHNMEIATYGNDVYVFYVGQLTGHPKEPVGNEVNIARLVQTPLGWQLVKVAEYRHAQAAAEVGLSFPHDVVVTEHPLTQQRIAWVSHWAGGAITVDVTDPLAPRELSVLADPAPSEVVDIHWYAPEPRPRGERLIAWSAPEIRTLGSGTGVVRAYDATDPAAVQQLGTWELPGDLVIPGQFLFSPHITQPDPERGLLAVSHYHAGVWVLDITNPERPRALGYYLPHGDPAQPYDGPIWWKKPNFDPDGFLPNVYQARWKDGLLWVTERGTGLYVLDYTGPVPGPV